jgi:glycosyltransferase involved in cell wall biosynthesis
MKRNELGIVIIGRNEGERLATCIQSGIDAAEVVVYVDSGSTDDSLATAKRLKAEVVNLDLSNPFTAARARNAGFQHLICNNPGIKFVQFIDGDCELDKQWLDISLAFLTANPGYAVVCGRRRERYPEASVYNLLCDLEWNTPVGDATACGGDALMRCDALQQVQGYLDDLIAGEEPEMCFRLRQDGWKIRRLDAEMTLHDAAMNRFGQWWQRTKRSGFAYAAGSALHGGSPEKYWVRETRGILFWGGLLPLTLFLLGIFISPWLLGGGLLVYPLQVFRITRRNPIATSSRKIALLYAFFVMLAKFPQMAGVAMFWIKKLTRQKNKLIEYK